MKAPRWQTCNVLQSEPQQRRLWQFEPEGQTVRLLTERKSELSERLPPRVVGKTWRNLWRPKVNAAWLPAEHVFLRVLHLPACEPRELPAMVEFQLEKVSPLPVGQIVWSVEPVPRRGTGPGPTAPAAAAPDRTEETEAEQPQPSQEQTVVVLIAAREPVEQFLGDLEAAGYLADRLELPHLREMLASQGTDEGVWIYPRTEGEKTVCLTAWWVEGRLQHVSLLPLPSDGSAANYLAQAIQEVAWAGEMEGWAPANASCHLVCEPAMAFTLTPALRALGLERLQVIAPLPWPKVAALCAQAHSPSNLVPAEYALTYRQQFIDRLWMRGLAALGVLYLVGVLGYFAALQFLEFKKAGVEKQIAALTDRYHQALRLKARVQVFQDQLNLKFAALDSWKAAAENLPAELGLTSLQFQRGKKLVLFGTVPTDQQSKVTEYNEALSKATVNGELLFARVSLGTIQTPPGAQPNRPATWSLSCELRQTEAE